MVVLPVHQPNSLSYLSATLEWLKASSQNQQQLLRLWRCLVLALSLRTRTFSYRPVIKLRTSEQSLQLHRSIYILIKPFSCCRFEARGSYEGRLRFSALKHLEVHGKGLPFVSFQVMILQGLSLCCKMLLDIARSGKDSHQTQLF